MKLPAGYVVGVGEVKDERWTEYGRKLMMGMGWKTGQGLGKTQSGRATALSVKYKNDTLGVCWGFALLGSVG